MIRLKNVSKFYYNKGLISSGFTKINVEFKLGEFVAITGESGSGKSTLLNVLSGLDSYEEGEMYINGEETSHYTEEDYEEYRKKYISNIFQSFNLINSYTVYQNVELILLISGHKKKKVKQKVIDLIKQVDLYKYRNTKVSKLSGGQKQRVAIARALAQNTPVIIADEPTGNLDKRSAESVLKTLKEVSKDKLVIIVTHNYEYVEEYATRKITMADGKIIEDKVLEKIKQSTNITYSDHKKMPFFNKLRLGIRNTLNIPVKFVLLLSIFLFIFIAITSEIAAFNQSKYEGSINGYNTFLQEIDNNRIIIKKKDGTPLNNNDFELFKSIDNVTEVIKNDYELETYLDLYSDNIYLYGALRNIANLNQKITYGRLPKNQQEVVVVGPEDNYYLKNIDDILDKEMTTYSMYSFDDAETKIKVVGVVIDNNLDYETRFYGTDDLLKQISNDYLASKTATTIKYKNQNIEAYFKKLDTVPSGRCYITNPINEIIFQNYYYNKEINIEVNNMYYNESLSVTIDKNLNKNNHKTITGNPYNEYLRIIYLNPEDYEKIYKNDIYQSSIIINDSKLANDIIKKLDNEGYKAYAVVNMQTTFEENSIYMINILSFIFSIIVIVILFFISYLIIKVILKSRQTYFTILRILGSTKKETNQILRLELLTIFNIATIITTILIILIKIKTIGSDNLYDMISFLKVKDYLTIYIIVFIMTNLISNRFARYIFKKSAIKTLNEEVI